MKEQDRKLGKMYLIICIILPMLFLSLEVLSYTYLNNNMESKLAVRVLARGVFGVLLLYNAIYQAFTKKSLLLGKNNSHKQRIISGILLAVVGSIMILTAFMGYGTNGDPRLLWWE